MSRERGLARPGLLDWFTKLKNQAQGAESEKKPLNSRDPELVWSVRSTYSKESPKTSRRFLNTPVGSLKTLGVTGTVWTSLPYSWSIQERSWEMLTHRYLKVSTSEGPPWSVSLFCWCSAGGDSPGKSGFWDGNFLLLTVCLLTWCFFFCSFQLHWDMKHLGVLLTYYSCL